MTTQPAPRRIPWKALLSLLLLGVLALQAAPDSKRYPGASWDRAASPEQFGWSSGRLALARDFASRIDTAAVVIVLDGLVLYEWGEVGTRYNIHSIRKSFLSALYGIHVAEGRISLTRTLEELGIDDNEPSLTAEEKKATVADLLKARSGVYHPALYETASMKAARPPRWAHSPGSFWYYNNWDFNALGTIFEQAVGAGIFEEFKGRLADPLGMEDYRVEDGAYVRGEDSIHPAYPFRMTARDLARFGLLYLRRGEWRGKRILSEEWVLESTRPHSDAGTAGGYGYLWWVAVDGRHLPGVRLPDGAYTARGAGGHYILILPDRDLVIVHRVDTYQRGKAVTPAQFGRLVQLILDARQAG